MPMFGSIAGAESVAARLRRRVRDAGGDGRGAARHRAGAPGQGHRQPDGHDPGLRRGAPLRRRARVSRAPSAPRARSTSPCSRRAPPACARPTSVATPPRASSPARSSRACARRSTSGPRSARTSRCVRARPAGWRPGDRRRSGAGARARRAAVEERALHGERERARDEPARDVPRRAVRASRGTTIRRWTRSDGTACKGRCRIPVPSGRPPSLPNTCSPSFRAPDRLAPAGATGSGAPSSSPSPSPRSRAMSSPAVARTAPSTKASAPRAARIPRARTLIAPRCALPGGPGDPDGSPRGSSRAPPWRPSRRRASAGAPPSAHADGSGRAVARTRAGCSAVHAEQRRGVGGSTTPPR